MVTLYRRLAVKWLPGQSSVADMGHWQLPPDEQWVHKIEWRYHSDSNLF